MIINEKLNPNFVTGFLMAKCFLIRMSQNTTKTGFWVGLTTSVRLNEKNINILKYLQDFFGGIGRIYHQENINEALFTVNSIKDFDIIISHFDKYPLKTKK